MDNENIESKSEISNMLNNYFVNVGANLSAQAGTDNLKASFINKMSSNMHSCFFSTNCTSRSLSSNSKSKFKKKQLVPKIFPLNFTKLLVNG